MCSVELSEAVQQVIQCQGGKCKIAARNSLTIYHLFDHLPTISLRTFSFKLEYMPEQVIERELLKECSVVSFFQKQWRNILSCLQR